MAKTRKFTKKPVKKEVIAEFKPVDPPVRSVKQVRRSAESYLLSLGTDLGMIHVYADWAMRRGYTAATNAEWKEIFSKL